jgi:hypothetical protein
MENIDINKTNKLLKISVFDTGAYRLFEAVERTNKHLSIKSEIMFHDVQIILAKDNCYYAILKHYE